MDVLRQFHEDPLPPSGVDVARAVRSGRRRRRARAAIAGVSLLAIITGLWTSPQWERYLPGFNATVGDSPPSPGTPPLTCDPLGPLPEPAPVTDGTAFDILRRHVDADAVTGYRIRHYYTSRYWQRVELVDASEHSTIEITLYAVGQQPVFADSPSTAPEPVDPTTGTPTEPVGSAAAYWLPGRQGYSQFEVARMGWLWSPSAWAFVAAADTTDYSGAYNEKPKTPEQIDTLRGIARQVATTLRLDADEPVTSPFTVPVPDCTRPQGTAFLSSNSSDGSPFTRFSLTFAEDGAESTNPLLTRGGMRTVEVTADSGMTTDDKPGSANIEVDGHPAGGEGDTLRVFDVDGFGLELNIPGGPSAANKLFRSVTIVPGAHDAPSAWTATPLRP